MPISDPNRKPDAAMYPVGWTPDAAGSDPGEKRANFLRPHLGSPMTFRVSDPVFVSRKPEDTILFPKEHAKEGKPRYEWVEQGNGLMFGYLLDQSEANSGG